MHRGCFEYLKAWPDNSPEIKEKNDFKKPGNADMKYNRNFKKKKKYGTLTIGV
jgi:hypothetical protein